MTSHQRSRTELIRVNNELPPLNTHSSQLSFHAPLDQSEVVSPAQLDKLDRETPQPLQLSPRRSKRITRPLFASEKATQRKTEDKVEKLANWFRGESEPINIGFLPSQAKEKNSLAQKAGASSQGRPPSLLQPKSIATSCKPAMASRFSFFSSKFSLGQRNPTSPDLDNDPLDLDISQVLSPIAPADPASIFAFKKVQQQVESLLERLQSAYREQTLQMREMAAEKEALAEEASGAETRARHLKMQLDDLSVKVTEQDEAMMNLVDGLALERLARREEEEARKRTIRLVEQASSSRVDNRRVSQANTVSDSGFESEDESLADSLFSRRNEAHSPTTSMSSISTSISPDANQLQELQVTSTTLQAARLRIPTSHTVKANGGSDRHDISQEPAPSDCPKYHGVRDSEAWSVFGVLQEENRCLKHRVEELESALDGCLDVVNRLS